jgi:hypothetical protein
MYFGFPILITERGIGRSLEIIVHVLRRLANDLAGLELMRGRDRNCRRVGLQSASPKIGQACKTRSPEHVGGTSDAEGPI